jgi:hypothetical protein
LSKEALDRVASQRVKTIANEDEIDSDIASTETAFLVMKEMQGATDALRASNTKFQKELADLKNTPNQTEPAPTESPLAEELKAIREMFVGLKSEVEAGKKKAHADAILAQAHEVMKKSGCTNSFIRNITLKGIEIGENDTAEAIAEKYKSVYDQNCREAFGDGYVPPMSNTAGSGETDQAEVTRILQERGLLPK